MNPIHELSAITTLPEYDIFAVPPTQTTVERETCYEYRPISTLDSKSTIEIVVESNFDEYPLLGEAMLFVKLQVCLSKIDKAAVEEKDWNNINVANYLLHTLFKHVDLYIGDKQINKSSTTYPYRAYIEALLLFDEEAKKTYLQSSGWYNDLSKRRALIAPLKSSAEQQNGRIFELMGRLHFDLTFQERALIGGTTIRLKLVPHDPKFFVEIADANLLPSIKFHEVVWHVPKSKIYRDVVDGHNSGIAIAPAKYPITRVEVKAYSIGKGSLDCSIENSIHGQLPRRLYLCLVSNDAFNGSYTKDPFKFQEYGVKFLCCYVDGLQYPTRAFTPDFANGNFTRAFMSLFHSSNQIFGKVTTLLSKDDYVNGNVIYGINFAPDLTDGSSSGHFNLIRRGSLRLEIQFDRALFETINVLMYCEFDNIIQINHDRNPVTDY